MIQCAFQLDEGMKVCINHERLYRIYSVKKQEQKKLSFSVSQYLS